MKTQFWNSFSKDDFSSYIRRGRLGLNAKIDDSWVVCTCFEFDNIGTDAWASSTGASKEVSVELWDMYMLWKPLTDKNSFVVTVGYTLPQISREVVTKPWFIPSLEKAKSSTYHRYFVIGKKSGISPLLNIGGIIGKDETWAEYNLSLIQAGEHYSLANSRSSLVCGRFSLGLGTKPNYAYKKKSTISSKKNRVVVGLNGSYQGQTEIYDQNVSCGIDAFGNYAEFKVSTEYTMLNRMVNDVPFSGSTGFCRMSYACLLKTFCIEPSATFCYSRFEKNHHEISSGMLSSVDTGIDYYCFQKTVKMSLHYLLSASNSANQLVLSDLQTEGLIFGLQFILK